MAEDLVKGGVSFCFFFTFFFIPGNSPFRVITSSSPQQIHLAFYELVGLIKLMNGNQSQWMQQQQKKQQQKLFRFRSTLGSNRQKVKPFYS